MRLDGMRVAGFFLEISPAFEAVGKFHPCVITVSGLIWNSKFDMHRAENNDWLSIRRLSSVVSFRVLSGNMYGSAGRGGVS